MTVTRNWKAGPVVFEAPYFDDLLVRNGGLLPPDIPAHALWHYYCVALKAYRDEKENVVYEGEPDKTFNAQQVFMAIANVHGVSPDNMLPYWGDVERQALLLGGEADALPPSHKFNRRIVQ
jgi:hypothetical protein